MGISLVELQGTVTRAQDYSTIKHNEDNKGLVDQSNYQTKFHKEVSDRMHKVRQGDNAENKAYQFDAKKQGNGAYSGDGGQKRKKQEDKKQTDSVSVKGTHGFDMKV